MSNTNGTGGESVTDTDDFTFDDVAREALAEIGPGEGTNNDEPPARDAAAATVDPNTSETPAAKVEQAPATPDHWSNQEQAAFDALPPETKTLVEKRIAAIEADYTTKNQPHIELANGIRSVIDETGARDTFAQSGMNEVEGVKYLANLERFARENPADYLKFVADHVRDRFGIDPAKVLGLGGQPAAELSGEDALRDPNVAALEERLSRVTNHLQQDAQRRALDTAGQQIASVRDAKDASGQPLRPHFADVENDMAALVRANPKMTLEEAYDAAVWSNPAVRTKLQAADREAATKKARDDAALAQKANRGNIRPGTRPLDAHTPIESADDAARAALAELQR